MSFTEKRLCNPTQLTTSGQTLYTVPASKTAIIKQLVVTNVTGSAATFSLYIGSATAANALFSATSVAANDAIVINLSQVLNSTEILTALASANSTLNITISGVENDGPLNPLSTYIADGAITSAKIADGAIVNADINSSAAIDKTKISGTAITAADTGTVTSTMILDGTISTADIANNAITQAKLSTDVPLSGMRNAVINGNFDIWQRGTPISTDAAATQIYTADRWAARALYPGNSSIQTITRESSTSHVPSGSRYSLKSVIGTSAVLNNARMQLSYALETADSLKFAGKQMTLSFKVKAIQNIDRIAIELRYNTTEGRIFDGTLIGSTTLAINSSSFTTCSYTFTVPSAVTLTSTGNFGFVLTYTRAAGTEQVGDGIYLAQVQLEEGSQLTPFEQRAYNSEFQLCQRYFQSYIDPPLRGVAANDTRPTRMALMLPVPMRVSPTSYSFSGTLNFWDGSSSGAYSSTYATFFRNTHVEFDFSLTVGYTAGKAICLYIGGGGTLTLSAEL